MANLVLPIVLLNQTTSELVPTTFTPTHFTLILLQLLSGLLFNGLILTSLARAMRQSQRDLRQYHRRLSLAGDYCPLNRQQARLPVIELILAGFVLTSLLRLLSKTLLQIICYLGWCRTLLSEWSCYVHGFASTFAQYWQLWMMVLLVQDRSIAHYASHDYLRKCSHCLLYLTLLFAAFLIALHLAGPVYGFSGYRFIRDDLSCAIDWLSPYSCPYWLYSSLFVLGPPLLPLAVWTVQLTWRALRAALVPGIRRTAQTRLQLHWTRIFCVCFQRTKSPTDKVAPENGQHSIELSPLHPTQSERKVAFAGAVQLSVGSTASGQSTLCTWSRSLVLVESREIGTVLAAAWLYLAALMPTLWFTFDRACLSPVRHPTLPLFVSLHADGHPPGVLHFYATFASDLVPTTLIPLLFILLHKKLRFGC